MILRVNHCRIMAARERRIDVIDFAIRSSIGWLANEIKEGSWHLSDRLKLIAQTQRRVPARKTSAGKAISSRTLIGTVYLVGMIPMVLLSPAAMQLLHKGAGTEIALQDLAQARNRQRRLRALRLGLVIESADSKQMRLLQSLERYEKAALSRQRRGFKRMKRNNQ
ncbi:hypothetical protein [Bradyrhizobium sp. 25ACV]